MFPSVHGYSFFIGVQFIAPVFPGWRRAAGCDKSHPCEKKTSLLDKV
jgi:hypothetical protein